MWTISARRQLWASFQKSRNTKGNCKQALKLLQTLVSYLEKRSSRQFSRSWCRALYLRLPQKERNWRWSAAAFACICSQVPGPGCRKNSKKANVGCQDSGLHPYIRLNLELLWKQEWVGWSSCLHVPLLSQIVVVPFLYYQRLYHEWEVPVLSPGGQQLHSSWATTLLWPFMAGGQYLEVGSSPDLKYITRSFEPKFYCGTLEIYFWRRCFSLSISWKH